MRFELIPLKPQFNMQTFTPYLLKKIPRIGFEPILMAHETIELPITPPKTKIKMQVGFEPTQIIAKK